MLTTILHELVESERSDRHLYNALRRMYVAQWRRFLTNGAGGGGGAQAAVAEHTLRTC